MIDGFACESKGRLHARPQMIRAHDGGIVRIKLVEICNFRCIQNVQIEFDGVTTFLGPNGAGKSSILRALDWFFNAPKSALTEDDVYSGAPEGERRIQVSVTFDQLTASDRTALGEKYAPGDTETFTAWRTWEDGVDKITGKAFAFPAFEMVRVADGVKAKKAALEEASREYPDLELPKWSTIAGVEAAMESWERSHPEHLEEARVSSTHFFGFHGQGKLSGLFDYVLVTADLRASEESVDGNNTVVGRILERAIDREAANDAFQKLVEEMARKQELIVNEHLLDQLEVLGGELSAEVSSLTSGRAVQLRAKPSELKAQPTRITVSIRDQAIETSVDRQGHGFQRAMLISALKLLAGRSAKNNDDSVICLAVEEPELFQHPTQARVFSTVLRRLAQGDGGLQVTYATHSPYFIEPRYFDQIRRVTRHLPDGATHPRVSVFHASMGNVCKQLSGMVADKAVRSRWDQVCIKHLAEAFFADAVVLVEGDDDKAIIDGVAARSRPFSMDGIVVAPVNGKGNLFTPYAILSGLGIPALVVFDNDSGCRSRMKKNGQPESEILQKEQEHKVLNRKFCRFFSALKEEDYPQGLVATTLMAVPDTLESVVDADWKEWKNRHAAVISTGRGVRGKNAATYALAAEECTTDPVGVLADIVKVARETRELGISMRSQSIPVQSDPSLLS